MVVIQGATTWVGEGAKRLCSRAPELGLEQNRNHRLGGGDIDAAIVHEVLIPQLARENALGPFDLTFEDKKKVLEPALLGLAEALKISLCTEVARLEQFGEYGGAERVRSRRSSRRRWRCISGSARSR